VTIEEFVGAMQEASGVDLAAFMGWYDQAGTPELLAEDRYDAAAKRWTLTLRQNIPPTPGQQVKHPVPIPVAMGLLDGQGAELPTRLAGENAAQPGTRLLLLEGAEQSFTFEEVDSPPVPSLLRGFSAPVRLKGVSRERLRFLAVHDTDPFVRWESGLQYATGLMLDLVAAQQRGEALGFDEALAEAVLNTLGGAAADPAFAAEALALPGEGFVADQMEVADPKAIHVVRQHLRQRIGTRCGAALRAMYDNLAEGGEYRVDGRSIGRRALRNSCLAYLVAAGDAGLAAAQYATAGNMTDKLAALSLLVDTDVPERDAALADFHASWRGDDLVLDKWFSIQAMSARPDAMAVVQALQRHPDFDLRNPNRARSLIGAFASGNPLHFHDAGGEGYRFLADAVIALDPINGSIAARLVSPLGQWRRQAPARAALMQRELRRVLETPKLSKGTFEKASKGLL
jgi:aminopeptidase N